MKAARKAEVIVKPRIAVLSLYVKKELINKMQWVVGSTPWNPYYKDPIQNLPESVSTWSP
jgi:hypothetical protein